MNPPLAAREDREALLAGLADGTVDAIATDHAPHEPALKDVEFDRAPFGILGFETALALALEQLVHPGRLSLVDRKSTRLNSSHGYISYAVFCLKKKNKVTTDSDA